MLGKEESIAKCKTCKHHKVADDVNDSWCEKSIIYNSTGITGLSISSMASFGHCVSGFDDPKLNTLELYQSGSITLPCELVETIDYTEVELNYMIGLLKNSNFKAHEHETPEQECIRKGIYTRTLDALLELCKAKYGLNNDAKL